MTVDMPPSGHAALALLATLALLPLAVDSGVPLTAGGRAASGPGFLPRQHTAVIARVGQPAELACRVLRLGDRTVSWVRSSDLQILTHAGAVFTADSRVSCTESEARTFVSPAEGVMDSPDDVSDGVSDEVPDEALDEVPGAMRGPVTLHVLRIARLRASDAGRYECQVNTEPKMSLFFNLSVVESALPRVVMWAAGRGAVRGAQGGAARLSCGARYEPAPDAAAAAALPPLRITWKHAGRDVDPQSTRGGVSLDSERWAGGAFSRLTLGALTAEDGGQYTCSAANASATVMLQISTALDGLHGEQEELAGEMQRDQAAPRVSAAYRPHAAAPPALLLVLALVAFVIMPVT